MGQDITRLMELAGLEFAKMTGTGNDFIIVDNTTGRVPPEIMSLLARAVCARRRSAGADGLIILAPTDRVDDILGPVDFRWDFFNADGSSAEMCGNGGRCAARFALDRGLAGRNMVFDTLAGPIRAEVKNGAVKLEMVHPQGFYRDLTLDVLGQRVAMSGVNTGVPHAVVAVEDIEAAPVFEMGRAIRTHPHFAPAGSNVNFMARDGERLVVRTYERGVEDETLACGTGVTAAALVAGALGWFRSPVTAQVRSGESLTVYFDRQGEVFRDVFLEGAADYVYTGRLHGQAFAWLERS